MIHGQVRNLQRQRAEEEERVTARISRAGDVPTKRLITGESDTCIGGLFPIELGLDTRR